MEFCRRGQSQSILFLPLNLSLIKRVANTSLVRLASKVVSDTLQNILKNFFFFRIFLLKICTLVITPSLFFQATQHFLYDECVETYPPLLIFLLRNVRLLSADKDLWLA